MESVCLRIQGNMVTKLDSVNLVLWLGSETEESPINKTTVIISGSDVFAVKSWHINFM